MQFQIADAVVDLLGIALAFVPVHPRRKVLEGIGGQLVHLGRVAAVLRVLNIEIGQAVGGILRQAAPDGGTANQGELGNGHVFGVAQRVSAAQEARLDLDAALRPFGVHVAFLHNAEKFLLKGVGTPPGVDVFLHRAGSPGLQGGSQPLDIAGVDLFLIQAAVQHDAVLDQQRILYRWYCFEQFPHLVGELRGHMYLAQRSGKRLFRYGRREHRPDDIDVGEHPVDLVRGRHPEQRGAVRSQAGQAVLAAVVQDARLALGGAEELLQILFAGMVGAQQPHLPVIMPQGHASAVEKLRKNFQSCLQVTHTAAFLLLGRMPFPANLWDVPSGGYGYHYTHFSDSLFTFAALCCAE